MTLKVTQGRRKRLPISNNIYFALFWRYYDFYSVRDWLWPQEDFHFWYDGWSYRSHTFSALYVNMSHGCAVVQHAVLEANVGNAKSHIPPVENPEFDTVSNILLSPATE